ncbi:ATP-dependent zinc metalloprotease FtsH [Propioniciclava sp. MC1595]|uniref:ATP-dependent zinc metalloprotease FtsH n=1 Tax=unclassified Propioniciclava TaxID=2642922 RepID=UPI0016014F5F|nr:MULTISPECIES: ATP-dependent zinc metalloprotease FtsH [unclassified Propioniciclava]MBB1495025.1 ATP-dependent zinc metalloprotease FtsH [Propioniciclava sp. MC1595]MBB1502134.1 ATP-dependent zinc metalloprotease FtsH [Propioniciclava sp. MC1683]QTE25638.1 ATP-dependent zinc metalloprotease FtsH [Propioniciclava sp. MC1595]
MKSPRLLRSPFLWILAGFLLIMLGMNLFSASSRYQQVPTSKIISVIEGNDPLREVVMVDGDQEIRLEYKEDGGARMRANWVGQQSQDIVERLNERTAAGTLDQWRGEVPDRGFMSLFLMGIFPFILIGLLFFWMLNSAQGGNRVLGFGKSKAKVASKDTPRTTFSDVAGCEEAIEELQEIREFLAEPGKFQAVGAKIPKGVLLYGPPGTGKTLLARAVAGEAGVPFFSISGSDFVEMFVGVGASRVRDLFEQAKEAAPAIIFIDEIDAVGRHRGAGMGGGHDEREQTLNQLLVEMDGFDVKGGVVLIAATNRPDVLDPALLRPGRFDRQIPVEAPDMNGRLQILRVHAANKPMAPDADLASVAKRTPGFTGADLANVLNEAALLTARQNKQWITKENLDEAIDRVIAGPQKRTRVMNERELLITAYHEGGHALVAAAMPGNDPVQKVTILPRGRALGYTMVMPDADKYSQTRGELLDQLAYMLGGRAAEELVFHDPTTGAANDIEKATKVAKAMVTDYGMTESLGAVKLGTGNTEPFLGMQAGMGGQRDHSEEVAAIIDQEVAALIKNAHQEAFDVLDENRDVLDELVRQLFEHETLDKEQVARIFEPLRKRPRRPAWTGSPNRQPSEVPPIDPPERKVPEPALPPGPPPGAPWGQQPPAQPGPWQPGPPVGPWGQQPPGPYGQPPQQGPGPWNQPGSYPPPNAPHPPTGPGEGPYPPGQGPQPQPPRGI